jgi:hypothetical protein
MFLDFRSMMVVMLYGAALSVVVAVAVVELFRWRGRVPNDTPQPHDASGLSQGSHVVAFSQTIKPLALAPSAGLAVLTSVTLRHGGPHMLFVAPYLAWRIAPFCYGAAVLFVLPILAIWPVIRRPSYLVAAIWGVFSAWAAVALFAWSSGQSLRGTVHWETLLVFGAAGTASGLLYAVVVRHGI